MPLVFTVYSLQLIVSQVERDQFAPSAEAERWRPLQAVVGQVQVLQLTQGLRESDEKSSGAKEKKLKNTILSKKSEKKTGTLRNSAQS